MFHHTRKIFSVFILLFFSIPLLFAEEAIVQKYNKYGSYYIKNMPAHEDLKLHEEYLDRISKAAEKIQGCPYKNPAIFNGFTADLLLQKAVLPMESLADNKKTEDADKYLVLFLCETDCDKEDSFKDNLSENTFHTTKFRFNGNRVFTFDKALLDSYDKLIVCQANGITADTMLDTFFEHFASCLSDKTSVDFFFLGHGSVYGVRLSLRGDSKTRYFGPSDFNEQSKFACLFKKIVQTRIDEGINPRVFLIGCKTDILELPMQSFLDEQYWNHLKIFGTPNDTYSIYVIGLNDDYYEMICNVLPIYDNVGLIIKVTDSHFRIGNTFDVSEFDTAIPAILKSEYGEKGNETGTLIKKSGVVMEYCVFLYNIHDDD